jgi:hypothetical protein
VGLLRLRRHAARLAGFGIAALALRLSPLEKYFEKFKRRKNS